MGKEEFCDMILILPSLQSHIYTATPPSSVRWAAAQVAERTVLTCNFNKLKE